MSLAGIRSARGDAYQVQVALDWVLRLLTDDDVESVQFESVGSPRGGAAPRVDDVVAHRRSGTVYIQAKKNEPARGIWSVTDPKLVPELVKAREQLERDRTGEVWLYSQSPFGRLDQLVEETRIYPTYEAFSAGASVGMMAVLESLSDIVDRDAEATYGLARRIRTKRTQDFDDWERAILREVRSRFARPEDVADLLVRVVTQQEARLDAGPLVDPGAPLTRENLVGLLRARGHVSTPERDEAELLRAFDRASRRGRTWKRDIDGRRFPRSEVDVITEALRDDVRSIVVTSGPGGGKTCVLLDVVERLEVDEDWTVLFVKGDLYDGAQTVSDLADRGLPDDIIGQASRLSASRRVVVVLDALDVLSLQRASGTLALFLGLLDELATVQGVSVVAACRDFDLGYAPELRDRDWGLRVRIDVLPEATVDGVLHEWGVVPETLAEALRAQLRTPQHLRLFGGLVAGGVTDVSAAPYALHDRFLDIVVERADGLGATAMAALVGMADRLQERRRLRLPRAAFSDDHALVERLLSADVLIEERLGTLSFSHQELLDCVSVRGAVRRGETLLDYLTSRPALPFVRPAARTFLFMLRAQDTGDFRQQARRVLESDDVAYHLRRLVAESLAEVTPEAEDLRLVSFLMRRHPDLFERFASRLRDAGWIEHVWGLLDDVRTGPDAARWTVRLLTLLNTWAGACPEVVVEAWRQAFTERWAGVEGATWGAAAAVRSALKEAPEGERPPDAVGALIRLLFDATGPDDVYDMAHLVQKWVEAVDGDDDLVVFVLERDEVAERDDRASRDFKGTFLEDRLVASTNLMDRVYEMIQRYVERDVPTWERDLLNSTSYLGRHGRGMMAGGSSHGELVRPFERAVVRRAVRGDAWWQTHEAELRGHDDWGLCYLAMRGYEASPARSARQIAAMIADPEILSRWSMASEVRELAHAAYPYLTDDEREAHQDGLLALYTPDAEGETWRARGVYERLLWVPRLWRTPDARTFIDTWARAFGPWRPQAEITSSGGIVAPPFSSDQLLSLDDEDIITLALHFGTERYGERDGSGYPIGGWDQAVGEFRNVASRSPLRLAALLPRLIDAGVEAPYLDAVVDGVGAFLRYRYGNVTMSGWEVAEDAEGESTGRVVLNLLERYGAQGYRSGHSQSPTWQEDGAPWLSEHTASGAARGCADVLQDMGDLDRLLVLLAGLAESADPEVTDGRAEVSITMSSVRGDAAESAVLIAGNCLDRETPLPFGLQPLLTRLASDLAQNVRWHIVRGLPYLTQFDADLGWGLADRALEALDAKVWSVAEPLFYHNYREDFARVAPYLERLKESGLAPEMYGRIGMLSALDDHLDADTFVESLSELPSGAWTGTAQVLTVNLPSASSRETCVRLLDVLLASDGIPPEAVKAVVHGLNDRVRPTVSRELIDRLIGLRDDEDGFRWTRIAEWIEAESSRDPSSAALALRWLADCIGDAPMRGLYGSRDEIGRALNAVLREADETDDPPVIREAVALQDRLTRLGILDADSLFEAASRE